MSFDELGLTPELLRAVADQGYTEPTPVQREAIPLVLAGRDLLAGAQTGTGKTARLRPADPPALNATRTPLEATPPNGRALAPPIRALVLDADPRARAPGRGERPDLRRHRRSDRSRSTAASASSPRSVPCGPAPGSSSRTPGRLLDHAGQRTIDLSRVEILVLDEADRMLDMGFIRDIGGSSPCSRRPPEPAVLGDFSDDIRCSRRAILHDPATVQVTPRNTATSS
jgi:ATP-dependent RNA helicase RhlE